EMTGLEKPAKQTRFGLMRLTRLLGTREVRRTADSDAKRIGGQARPERKAWPERGRMGWLETECLEVHVSNQGCLPRCWKERGRSQSPHSSDEVPMTVGMEPRRIGR